MSNPPPVKTPLSPGLVMTARDGVATNPSEIEAAAESAATVPEVEEAEAEVVVDESEPPLDPAAEALIRLLRPVAEPVVHPEAEQFLPLAVRVEISLTNHWLRVIHRDEAVVESPLATGRSISPTPEGRYQLAAKPPVPPTLRYGHYRTRAGVLLVRGVFPKIDPLPADAVFDPIAPKGLMQLSDDGPMIFGGEATGAATTDGTLVLPDRIALLLHEKLPMGVPVVIGP